jgi:hypothetical protein
MHKKIDKNGKIGFFGLLSYLCSDNIRTIILYIDPNIIIEGG